MWYLHHMGNFLTPSLLDSVYWISITIFNACCRKTSVDNVLPFQWNRNYFAFRYKLKPVQFKTYLSAQIIIYYIMDTYVNIYIVL